MFKIGRKDEGLSKKFEVIDLKFEINSVKMLQFEERMSNLEKRLTNLEMSNRKLSEAMMKLVEILRGGEEGRRIYPGVATPRQPLQRTYGKRDKTVGNQATRMALEDQIVEYLRNNGPSTPTQMQVVFNRSREHISRTLKALSENGIVERKKEGRTFIYNLSTAKEEKGPAPEKS